MEHYNRIKTKGGLCLRRQPDGSSLIRKYRVMGEAQGLEKARQLALDEMLAAIIWLNDTYGARATYDMVQQNADDLVTNAIEYQ